MNNLNIDELINATALWHNDRNLIEGSDDKTQFAKLIHQRS